MNVHLVRNSDLGCGTFDNISSYLNYVKDKNKPNPIKFIGHAVDPTKDVDIITDRTELANHIKRIKTDGTPYDRNDFKRYFDVCESIRTRDKIASSEIVILLTNQFNASNYFGYCDDDIKNSRESLSVRTRCPTSIAMVELVGPRSPQSMMRTDLSCCSENEYDKGEPE